ncbi:putative RNA methyltransferase [Streptomyces sp. NPDC059578]|uniref:putative RNA methyltransferase n=1 Tax=Streptomyces sp. NPDC059578 TaxID=3346874 RepID=UPI0036834A8B
MPVPFPPALTPLLDLLRCPMCRAHLSPDRGALRCPAGHAFDIARHGYVGLLTGARATSGDDADMVRARDRFLATGRYRPIREAVARLAAGAAPERGTVLDVGCGTGRYLAGVLNRWPAARGLDLVGMTPSARRPSRTDPDGDGPPPGRVTVSVLATAYRPRCT